MGIITSGGMSKLKSCLQKTYRVGLIGGELAVGSFFPSTNKTFKQRDISEQLIFSIWVMEYKRLFLATFMVNVRDESAHP